ncbi:hypothetical protein BDV23DRAFT_192379 [Aspergillus alliaceus]|uniref:NAD(P)-binding domain-containing protein n=1 Tax=Petromyces alliaceus TaxID=209559 RepID=A0A5N7BQ66_PETAA|nr:hypothetical protein BDV23DRAFT_192379 [Aspergillus alliaceus]
MHLVDHCTSQSQVSHSIGFIPGWTGSVGQTIVEALVAHGKHKGVILTRKPRTTKVARPSERGHILAVDYGDVDATRTPCVFGMESDAISEAQVNLLRAADLSGSTKRFVVSGYDMLFNELWRQIAQWRRRALSIPVCSMAYFWTSTAFRIGEATSSHGLTRSTWQRDGPGDGLAKVNFITSQDMARLVARLMDLPEWSPSPLADSRTSERFSVIYDRLHGLRNGRISFPEFQETGLEGTGRSSESIFALFHYISSIGGYTVPSDNVLDARFPDIRMTTAREVIKSSWRDR